MKFFQESLQCILGNCLAWRRRGALGQVSEMENKLLEAPPPAVEERPGVARLFSESIEEALSQNPVPPVNSNSKGEGNHNPPHRANPGEAFVVVMHSLYIHEGSLRHRQNQY